MLASSSMSIVPATSRAICRDTAAGQRMDHCATLGQRQRKRSPNPARRTDDDRPFDPQCHAHPEPTDSHRVTSPSFPARP